MFTVNNYDSAHSHAYKVLNMVQAMLGDKHTLVHAIAWEWEPILEKAQMRFTVKYKGNMYSIVKNDNDMFDAEWYQSAAEEITAWLLLQRGAPKLPYEMSFVSWDVGAICPSPVDTESQRLITSVLATARFSASKQKRRARRLLHVSKSRCARWLSTMCLAGLKMARRLET